MWIRIVVAATAIAALYGCGDNGAKDGGGITGGKPTQASISTAPAASAVSVEQLRACLKRAGVMLVNRGASYENSQGQEIVPGVLDVSGSTYVGLALWPTKHVAAVWLAPNDSAADAGEKQLTAYVTAAGAKPADYLQRKRTVLVLLEDHDQPTRNEAKLLNDCAMGT